MSCKFMPEFESRENRIEGEEVVDEFEVGDLVIFNREHPATVEGFGGNQVPAVLELIDKYGEGPFQIMAVRENDQVLIEAGHPKQILRLERPDGAPVSALSRIINIPSSWFKKHSPQQEF